jgi:hypothetical protein
MTPIKCFMVEETSKIQRYLRRYHNGDCTAPWTPFGGMVKLDIVEQSARSYISDGGIGAFPRADPRWPKRCECGREFTDADQWQLFTDRIYRRTDTGQETSLRLKVPGMMWDAWWMPDVWKGMDGRCLSVVCPDGHEWMIDGVCSNCTLPSDHEHRCWIRHGEPPNLTVDKRAGIEGASAKTTCAAGAGSILTPKWHGFLRAGHLVE